MDLAGARPLDWTLDPLAVLARWPVERRVLMLHSGRLDRRWSRYTMIGSPDGTLRITGDPPAGQSTWLGDAPPPAPRTGEPWRDLAAFTADSSLWIGYLAYDLARWSETLPSRARDDRRWPVLEFGRLPGWLVHDRLEGRWYACGSWAEAEEGGTGLPALGAPLKTPIAAAGEAESVFSPAGYREAVRRVLDYIGAGDVFQVNLAQRFTVPMRSEGPRPGRSLFHRLAGISPAWYGAYMELAPTSGSGAGREDAPGRTIASTSPELFLEITGREVITRPIKGTRPASVAARELEEAEKDTAELAMIVDLMRNDLGRACRYGSVRVPEARRIETHPTIHHGVATVRGELAEGRTLDDLLRVSLPGGSVTGAPKIRAMEIIEELEPVRRGPYCGAIGWIRGEEAAFNIAIRTLLLDPDRRIVDFSVGGGIVADSKVDAEYEETLDKAAAMIEALRAKKADSRSGA